MDFGDKMNKRMEKGGNMNKPQGGKVKFVRVGIEQYLRKKEGIKTKGARKGKKGS